MSVSAADSADASKPANPEEAIPLVTVVDPATAPRSDGTGQPEKPRKSAGAMSGLTKAELEAFANDPFWCRVRRVTLALFCLVWLGMFAAVIAIVVASPKCPPRPTRQFWQRPFYRLQLPAFAPAGDADPSAVGSVAGLTRRLGHLRATLGVNNLLLGGRLLPDGLSGCPREFATLRPELGTLDELKTLTKAGRKKGFNLMMELDLSQADPAWAAADRDGVFVAGSGGGSRQLRSRDSGAAWSGGRLHLPRSTCNSLNVSSPAVLARLDSALTSWLDAGLSGFLLTNVAFVLPSAASLDGLPERADGLALPAESWFACDPTPALYSNASVEFVRWARRLLTRESARLGRDLALFVDPGNTGFPQPADRLAAYLDPAEAAHAVVSVGLGLPLSERAQARAPAHAGPAEMLESLLAAAAGRGSVLFVTSWPSLRRPSDPFSIALPLTLPGVPCLYYGQELGMAHVAGVQFPLSNPFRSYLEGDDSTDASETPMQWDDSGANAGWLANATTKLAWADLEPRADDILSHNLRLMAASGHPQSALQIAQRLLSLASSVESLQWGDLRVLKASSGLLAFRRQAVRYPAVLVVANWNSAPVTVDLSAGGATGRLRLMMAGVAAGGRDSSYQEGQSYPLDRVFVPGGCTLIFQADS